MPDPWSYSQSNTEHAHQVALFMWCNMAEKFGSAVANDERSYKLAGYAQNQYNLIITNHPSQIQWRALPQLKWLHAIHNQGHGDKIRGAHAKAEGVKAGVFDLFLPYPVALYETQPNGKAYEWRHGLYLEMKRPKSARGSAGVLSDAQNQFKAYAENVGYATAEAWTWLEARDALCAYLGLSQQ